MMSLADLRSAIAEHQPWDAHEAEMQQQMLAFVDGYGDCLHRTQLLGHITASAWVVSEDGQQVLLIHHRKLDKWLQPGGHADGEADTVAVAQREVLEETGLETVAPLAAIWDLDIHPIPARGAEPAHLHYDVRHLLRPVPGSVIDFNHEVKAAEWVYVDKVHERANERSVMRMVEKHLAVLRQQDK